MTRNTRRFLFYSLAVIFVILGTIIVLYSQGWRIDTDSLTITRTGGVFIRTNPKETKIFIDGEEKKRSNGFLLSGTLIKNLVPKNYEVKISLDGYRTWENSLPVKESLVTEVKDIVLLPDMSLPITGVASKTAEAWLVNGELATRLEESTPVYKNYKLSGERFVTVMAGTDSLITYNPRQDAFLINNVRERSTINLSLLFDRYRLKQLNAKDNTNIKIVAPNPYNVNLLAVKSSRGGYLMDLGNEVISWVATSTIEDLVYQGSDLLFSQNKGLYKGVEGELLKEFERTIESVKANTKLMAIKLEDGSLWMRKGGEEIKRIGEGVKEFQIYESRPLVIYQTKNNKTHIFYYDKEKETVFSLPRAERIKTIIPMTDTSFIVVYEDNLFFLQIGEVALQLDEPILYFQDIVTDTIKEALYEEKSRVIYYINQKGDLWSIDYFSGVL